ncbi:MAG: radical SAM protein [Anaerolineae bacterium]
MLPLSIDTQPDEVGAQVRRVVAGDPERWRQAWQVRAAYHAASVRFDRPAHTLPVSLTGGACSLNCAHCGGHYLKHMQPIWAMHPGEATSCLISGGCDPHGRVPVGNHLETVRALKDDGRRLNWHVGLIDEDTMRTIAPLVDLVSFDVVGDAETAREVYGLELTLDDYMRTFDMLRRHAPVVPHITVGLRGGRLSGERLALQALAAREVPTLVLIVLIPTEGTAYAHCAPPSLDEVADIMLLARTTMPRTRLYLGCMRPHGAYRQALDDLALRAGANVLVNPTLRAERVAADLGLDVEWGDECCALD